MKSKQSDSTVKCECSEKPNEIGEPKQAWAEKEEGFQYKWGKKSHYSFRAIKRQWHLWITLYLATYDGKLESLNTIVKDEIESKTKNLACKYISFVHMTFYY